MSPDRLRVVDKEGSSWAIRAARGQRPLALGRTQKEAVELAEKSLAEAHGGTLEVYTEAGARKKRIIVEPLTASVNTATPTSTDPNLPVENATNNDATHHSGRWPEKGWPMTWVWAAAAFCTLIFGYLVTPWEALQVLAEVQDIQTLMWEAAGYTLPAVIATIASFFAFRNGLEGWNGVAVSVALFFFAALICNFLELGLPVDLNTPSYIRMGSHLDFVIFVWVVASGYINSWGFGLFLTAIAIGTAAGMQLENWLSGDRSVK